MNETIQLFREIIGDSTFDSREITKFLQWGSGNLEQALNYYYRRKEKENRTQSQTTVTTRSRSPSNAFTKMNNAMIKQKRTEEFISKVREEYKLPIRARNTLTPKSQPIEKNEENAMDLDI